MAKPHHHHHHTVLLIFFFIATTQFNLSSSSSLLHSTQQQGGGGGGGGGGCEELDRIKDPKFKCDFLRSQNHPCPPEGYIDYLSLFYCVCGHRPLFGYFLLILWLLVLFYLLGNTASHYFCSSLESLSKLLRLPPTIAGITLLSLGNGAPDVFSTVVSFAASDVGDVGLSSVLGGAFFVSSVVVGVISICIGSFSIAVDRASFLRDACFFLAVLSSLLAILAVGEIGVAASALFVCLYAVYVVAVSVSYCWRRRRNEGMETPLLVAVEVEDPPPIGIIAKEDGRRRSCFRILYFLQLPLYLPRRLTIPDVSEERWSKPFATSSVVLAPILLAVLWNTRKADGGPDERLSIYLFAGLAGLIMGIVAFETTESSEPPKKYLLPWLAGGFLMSVVWTYITAGELVSLLVSIGHVLGISPSVLGATVLAWGNSVGDLIANVAMSLNGGADGAQIAISGCYAGPIFNTSVGLGVSLVLASWRAYPLPYAIPSDPSLFLTLGFLAGGLLWALVMLPRRGMKLDRVVGMGLLAIYCSFLCIRIFQSTALVRIGT